MKRDIVDLAVVGLGIMGTCAVHSAATSNLKVLGIEQFNIAHPYGSSHGGSRIFRSAYWEGETYVPLALRAHELWQKYTRELDKNIFHETGGVFFGDKNSQVVLGSIKSAVEYKLKASQLEKKELSNLIPGVKTAEKTIALWEKTAGVIHPEIAIQALTKESIKNGATIVEKTQVIDYRTFDNYIEVITSRDTYYAKNLLITVGPWIGHFMPSLSKNFQVKRICTHWFKVDSKHSEKFPIFLHEMKDQRILYGMFSPDKKNELKFAWHNYPLSASNPNNRVEQVEEEHVKDMIKTLKEVFPGIQMQYSRSKNCFYTLTRDENFVIDQIPNHQNIWIAAGMSGHGFKFAPAIGEMIIDSIIQGKNHINNQFKLERFKKESLQARTVLQDNYI